MFSYDRRSTRFLNVEHDRSPYVDQKDWPGVFEDDDIIYSLAFRIGSDSKVITRTRRKFWDDVSLRGG